MMSELDANLIKSLLSVESRADLARLELFASIESTNTYLLAQPPPSPGRCNVVIADHQTAGRGRHFRRWISQPGASLCLSFAHTFHEAPKNMSSMTLAIGVGIITGLEKLGVTSVGLKWPNDLVARDAKLGGILTEVQARGEAGPTVIAGVGINLNLPAGTVDSIESDWSRRPIDLHSISEPLPSTEAVAAAVIEGLHGVMRKFSAQGFAGFASQWAEHDWLCDREITVDLPDRQITGIAAGVDVDGALLVNTGKEMKRVVSGSIVMTG